MFEEGFFFLNQKRVDNIARSLGVPCYQEGLIEWKMCSGEGKTGVGERNRRVFRRGGLTQKVR